MPKTLDANEAVVFKNYLEKLHEDGRNLAELLYESWDQLGVRQETSLERIRKLNAIIQSLFEDIREETNLQILNLKKEIKALNDEAIMLGKYLSLDIDISDCVQNKPLYVCKEMLEDRLKEYRQEVTSRKMQIAQLREWQDNICRSLGKPPIDIREKPLLSKEEVSKLRVGLELLQKERDKRLEAFIFQRADIKDLMGELNLAPSNEFERKLLNGEPSQFVLNDENLAKIMKLHESLSSKLQQVKNMVMELREQLHTLWERLEEDPVYRGNFLDAHPGHSLETIKALKDEIARCVEKKRQNLKMFIAKLRTDILKMWEKCLFGEKDKSAFAAFNSESFSEGLLDSHEEYFRRLQAFYMENVDIFKLYDERRILWRKMQEIEARGAEPSRLNNRGGQLLREERDRKAIANKLPKLEALLADHVKEYEVRTGKTFTVNDQPMMQIIEDEWEGRKQERQLKLSARKHKGGLTPTTSSVMQQKVSPLGKRNVTSKITPVPTKKQALMTMSASRAQVTTDTSNLIKRSAVTSIKKNVSPRLASRTDGGKAGNGAPRRRLRLSDKTVRNDSDPALAKNNNSKTLFKAPTITINGNILKNKRRLSGKRKLNRRKSLRRQSSKSSELAASSEENSLHEQIKVEKNTEPDTTTQNSISYSDFQDHLHGNAGCRSSVVPERILQVRKNNANRPEELPMVDGHKGNANTKSPMKPPRALTPKRGKENILANGAVTPKSQLHAINVFGVTPNRITRSNTQIISKTPDRMKLNVESSTTPRIKQEGKGDRPAKNCSFLPLRRQNTVTLYSPMRSEERPMLRSSSAHNLLCKHPDAADRRTPASPSANRNPSKLQLAKKLPLII